MSEFVQFETPIGTMLVRKSVIWGVTVSKQESVPSEIVLEGGARSIKVDQEVAKELQEMLLVSR